MTPGFAGGFGYDLPGYTIADELAGLMALSETPYDQVKPHIKAVLKYLVGFCQACGEEYDDTSRLMLHHDHGTGACVAILCVRCNAVDGRYANVTGGSPFPFSDDWWARTVVFAVGVWFSWMGRRFWVTGGLPILEPRKVAKLGRDYSKPSLDGA